ncbi:MAG: two-component regulator propeller domain-containing protein, partial [Paludibacter sp.]
MKDKILLTIALLFIFLSAWSLPYKVSYLTADNGLSRNMVADIFRDSRGFMWISTSNGLDRYDGYEFIHFNSRNMENHLQNDNVHCVEEDKNGNLWIGTENGLYLLNYQSGEIESVSVLLRNRLNLISKSINFIKKDESGDIWVGYDNGLAKLHYTSGNIIETEDIYHGNSSVRSFLQFNGSIYIG